MANGNGIQLPPGYTVDPTPAAATTLSLPPGYKLDQPASQQQQPQAYEKAVVPALGGGFIAMDVPQGQARQFQQSYQQGATQGGIAGLAGIGAAAVPELAPEASPGVLGYLTNILTRVGLTGAGTAAGTSAGQALGGENPLSPKNLSESLQSGAYAGATTLPFEMLGQLPFTKAGRSAINLSLGAQARDVTYGNPAKGILNEGISNVATGDFEAYKDALRQGASQADASQAAGGRFAAVNQKINQIVPRLNNTLGKSNAQIPLADAVDKPLEDAAIDIIRNPAMTQTEKDAAITQLGGLQQSIHQSFPAGATTATPSELLAVKQAVGDRVNWGGATAIGDEVKPAYRDLYGSLKNSIHNAVPESAQLDERLSNLMAAQNDLLRLSRLEEAGRGMGITRGKIGSSLVGAVQSGLGRFLPQLPPAASPFTKGIIGSMATAIARKGQQ